MPIFTVGFGWHATGEGWVEALGVVMAPDDAAAEARLFEYLSFDPGAPAYYRPVVRVTAGLDRERLGVWVQDQAIPDIQRAVRLGGHWVMMLRFNAS